MITRELNFEELLPFYAVNGKATLHEGPSTDGFPAGAPTNVIQRDQPVSVAIKWESSGLLVPFLAGEWRLNIYMEQMGQGEYTLPISEASVNFNAASPTQSHVFNIAPNTVPAGLYRVLCSLTLVSPDATGNVPGPVAAFAEFGLVQFYQA